MTLTCLAVGLLLAAGAWTAAAQDAVVIYRCTDASGAVTVQNDVACPKGSKQQRRVIETATPPAPAPVAAAAPVPLVGVEETPDTVEPTPVVEIEDEPTELDAEDPPVPPAERTPPPPLFACKTWNREEYFSDAATPAQRCAPMQTTGLGGDPAMGAGAACMVVSDFCQPVPDAALCESWRDHLIRSEAIVEFKRAEDPVAATAELERVRAIVRGSTCAD